MKMIKKLSIAAIVFRVVVFNLGASVDATESGPLFYSEDPLIQAFFELGYVGAVVRIASSDKDLPEGFVKDLQDKFDPVSILSNYVCAQVYAVHLKELRSGWSGPGNYYSKHKPTDMYRPLVVAMKQGGGAAGKAMEGDQKHKMEVVHVSLDCIKRTKAFLCREFESSYRKLFDLKEGDKGIQNPYYAYFCQDCCQDCQEGDADVQLGVKEKVNEGL